MKDVSPTFKKFDNGDIVTIGYKWVNFHMIFDINMEYFRHKAGLVTVGHMMEPPATITHDILVLKETVRIAMKLAELNDLSVKVSEIQNAYTTAPVTKKIRTVLVQNFGEDSGRKATAVWALYGLKSVADVFRYILAD